MSPKAKHNIVNVDKEDEDEDEEAKWKSWAINAVKWLLNAAPYLEFKGMLWSTQ